MHHQFGEDRDQIQMVSIQQLVGPESFVRIIDAFVDALDLKALGFRYAELNAEGRPPYHPATMMKIYIYGYHYGIRSCRKLEHSCKTNIEVIWLTRNQHPHYKTIANFRADNKKAFKNVFRHFLLILKEWKLIDGKSIAIDSFKIRAQNSLKNNFNDRKLKRHLEYIDAKIKEYQRALDQEEMDKPAREKTKQKIKYNKEKKVNYRRLKNKMNRSRDGQISTTDPDAKAVVFQRNSVKIGYNVQAASDSRNKLLVAADLGDVNDTKALAVMVGKTKENIGAPVGRSKMNVLADKGYHSGRELKACDELGVLTYISPKESSSHKAGTRFAMDQFKYNKRYDTYTCPAGESMKTNGVLYNKKLKNGRKSYHVKHYKTRACKTCQLRSQCTINKYGRTIERTEYADYVEANDKRVNNNPDYYRKRQQYIEHQFGTIKRQWGFDYCLTRGKESVLGEVYMAFTTYNLRRSLSILGFSELLRRIKAIFGEIFAIFCLTSSLGRHSRN